MINITQILTENIKKICDESNNCYNTLIAVQFKYEQNQRCMNAVLDRLAASIRQMAVHMNLSDLQAVDVDFYSEICSYFKNRKGVEFYIQEGYDGALTKVNDTFDINGRFVVNNCLAIMRLVPMQLVNNAIKYKPKGTPLVVELTRTDKRNHIKFKNWGPYSDENEISNLTQQGVRGRNTLGVAGMGIGLSEVKDILMIHKNWLHTTFDIESSDKILNISNIPYSEFVVEISYSAENTTKSYQEFGDQLEHKIPMILMHNYQEILSNLLDICNVICKINEKNNNAWRSMVYRLRTNINYSQNVVRTCLYLNDNKSIDNLLGNQCVVNLTSAFVATISNVQKYFYPDRQYDIQGKLCEKKLDSSIYTCINGIVWYIFDSTFKNSQVEITFEKDHAIFECDNLSFRYKFDNDADEDFDALQLQMLYSLFKALNVGLTTNDNKIQLNFY